MSVLLEVLVAASETATATEGNSRQNVALTGFSPRQTEERNSSNISGCNESSVEKIYFASKALLTIAKTRGPHLKVRISDHEFSFSKE